MNRFLLFALLASLSMPATAAPDCPARLEYDEIVAPVSGGFYDRTFRGLDWPARVARHRKSVECKANDKQVAHAVNELLAELRSSHLKVYVKSDLHYWGLNSFFSPTLEDYQLNFSGIWPEQRDGQWYAKYVLEGSPAARAGISQGDRLIRINDAAFDQFSFTGGSDRVMISSDGKTRNEITLRAEHESVMQALVTASAASRKILTAGNRQIGYFHLWAARDAILKEMRESLAHFESARVDALIIDYRGGYGGTSMDYLDAASATPYLAALPKVYLIDDGVRSGKEMLVAFVKRDKLGTLVGSRTAGAFVGAKPVRLHDDKYFLILAAYGSGPSELPKIEGVGVLPDVEIPPCRQACAGHDPQLIKALKLLSPS
jgi:carboxyl-terminal processing protease